MSRVLPLFIFSFLFFIGPVIESASQGLYTARGYWEESTKSNYLAIQKKAAKGDSLNSSEKAYVQDYEVYLATYFQRLSADEKAKYDNMKPQWDRELAKAPVGTVDAGEFEWRGRDRVAQFLYGAYYGATVAVIGDVSDAAAVGIPLLTGGLYMLGPALNPKKYENITRSTLRASNTGKLLGLGYGLALGVTIAGNSSDAGKLALGLSTAGSIAMGEIGFHLQMKQNIPIGRIDMIRHYGFLGPWVGIAGMTATGTENPNLQGASLLAGGVVGMIIGNRVAKKYDYTQGDVDAISTLTWITTAAGVTAIVESSSDSPELLLIPAATSIAGTIWGQRAVRGMHLTNKQGSTINLSVAGAALFGLGVMAIAEVDSPAALIGIPTGLALITHQALMSRFRKDNLSFKSEGRSHRKRNYHLSLNVTPESYFINKHIPTKDYSPQTISNLQQPLVRVHLKF